jgi:hypothetical protein
MKKMTIATIVAATALIAGTAFAQMGWGGGPGMGGCNGMMGGTDKPVNIENLKKFQKETLSLRDELVTKHAEIGNEYGKPTPDTARIVSLKKELIDIQAKIQIVAEKYGIAGRGPGFGRGMMGHGGMMAGCPCSM